RDDAQIAIDLHRIGIDDRATEFVGKSQRKRRLAASGRPCDQDGVGRLHRMLAQEYIVSMEQPVVSRNPEVMGGTPVFSGSRVPVQTLLDYLEGSDSIDEFLEGFPSVTREQVVAFLNS